MKFLKKWIQNWINSSDIESGGVICEPVRKSERINQDKSIEFMVWFANGGRVVQTVRYDPKKDENVYSLHIISDDKNFGEEIDKILTVEALRG
jgi:hypothetical protein